MKTYRLLNIELLQTLKLKWYLLTQEGDRFSYVTNLPFKDYFFVTPEMIEPLKELYADTEFEITEMSDSFKFAKFRDSQETVYKIEINNPFMKTNIRIKMEEVNNMLISEGDITYVELVMKDLGIKTFVHIIDNKVVPAKPFQNFPALKHVYYDIETDDRQEILKESKYEGFAKPDVVRILSASTCDAVTGEIKHFVHDDERILKNMIATELNKYHVIQAWNGNDFDFKFFKRFIDIDVPFNPNMFILLDAMKIHEMLNYKERQFVSLDMAGQRYLDIRKIQHKWRFYDAWLNHREELEVYNNRDVELMYKLEEKFGFAGIVMQTAKKIGFLPQKYTYSRYSSIIAIMVMSLDHYDKRIIWKSKSIIPIEEAYEGALVLDSIKGRWKNVLAVDLKSLYNTIIQTYNISPEQLVIYKDGSHDYSRFDHIGIMVRALQLFEVDRDEAKALRDDPNLIDDYKVNDQIQAGLKIVLLSIYGGLGARGSTRAKAGGKPSGAKSFYNWHCANDTTFYARKIILIAKTIIEAMGYKVVYGDTDSLYIYVGDGDLTIDDIRIILKDMVGLINKDYATMLDKANIPMERRKIQMDAQGWYSPFILFGKKKHYFAKEIYNAENDHINEEFVMYAKGIKAIKVSEPMFIRNFQETLYKMILKYDTLGSVKNYIDTTRLEFFRGIHDSELVFETKLTKNTAEYVNKQPHVKLAERLIADGRMQEKSTIFYVIADTHNNKAIAQVEGSPIRWAGRNYVWQNRVKKWVTEIMYLIFYDEAQTSLEDFLETETFK